ncbi:helix-turn-helix domain-containing protein [Actinomadura graeca]|uniref:Helix-turn-helix domain-containing protein n=1 Tax=Actinomadura graeca TaxID=2750812 RepID=A0ABX8QY76_9ACTN|nr:helix-turn-helix domain-containing protein [Actinomadura graeca]QXJ23761.1 helix-turn-helix domain-containing protein [Actinomadura graeca]
MRTAHTPHVNRCARYGNRRAARLPSADGATRPFRSIAVYVTPGVGSFGLSGVSSVFRDRSHRGLPPFELLMCGDVAGVVRTDLGWWVDVPHGLGTLARADLVIVPPTARRPLLLGEAAVEALRSAHDRGAIVAGFCSGSELLAAAGLPDDRRPAGRRGLAALTRRHPPSAADPGTPQTDAGRLATGIEAGAGIELCLRLLRREHGPAVSEAVTRQAMECDEDPGAPRPWEPGDADLVALLSWARTRLDQPLSVGELARRASMSPRTFARRFRAAIGTTPIAWLRDQRLDHAEALLLTTDEPISVIAQAVGFQPGQLRAHFMKRHGVPPNVYRGAARRAGR